MRLKTGGKMEKFPTGDNPENINQEPAADENAEKKPLPYEEEMDKRQHYEQLFKEMKQNGALPEGVTDAYELREYTEEAEAHAAEQSKAEQEAENESNKRIEQTVNTIEAIKDTDDKNLAISIFGYFGPFDKFGLGPNKMSIDRILEYNQSDSDQSFLEFLEDKRIEDGCDTQPDNYFPDFSDKESDAGYMWETLTVLMSGNKVQREMRSGKGPNGSFDIKFGSYDLPFLGIADNESEKQQENDAAIRLHAKTLASKYTTSTDEKNLTLENVPEEDREQLVVLCEMYDAFDGDINKYAWDIIERTVGDRKYQRLNENDLASNLKDCLNVKTATSDLRRSYNYYKSRLERGQRTLDNFKKSNPEAQSI